jgi:UDP-GlcNAc:undecaprenyl-phosphate GlcNAc-1-phosphate transferase
MSIWTRRYLVTFAVAAVTAYLLTPVIIFLSRKFGILSYPEENKLHTRPTPVFGGVAVYLGFAIASVSIFYYTHAFKTIVAGGLVVLALGIVDDLRKVPAYIKLAVLFMLAYWLSLQGVVLQLLPVGFPLRDFLNLIVSIFWIAGVISAFNAVDNMDGLASGIACICAFMFFIVSVQTSQRFFGVLAIALAGSTLGFLKYNFKPARIFPGNSGSLFLGFTLAVLAVMGEWSENAFVSMVIPVMILAIPIIDIIFVVLWRHANGLTANVMEAIEYCDTDHISHRLQALGLSQRKVVFVLYLLSACIGIGAVILREAQQTGNALLLFIQLIMLVILIGTLLNIEKDKLKRFFYPKRRTKRG